MSACAPAGTLLGQTTEYVDTYRPDLLTPIPRSLGRDAIGVHDFRGTDVWRLYEITWINERGLPVAAAGEIRVPATSPCIVESKSLKLYIGSLTQTKIASVEEAARLIDEVLADGGVSGGILAVPVADTIKRADKSRMILETVPRSDLWRAATPQMFRVHDLVEALSGDLAGITDEASAMERLGRPVRIVPGRTTNIKVTEPADGVLASLILGDGAVVPFRVGQGYDSHRLVEGRPLILGGVQIPFELGLDGHSDADVLLHAVTDAVLGAAALGDIGQHFPPSDPKWKGADSRVLLRAVVALARLKGWIVVNCDATIVAERPKIGPHMPAIRASLAETLGVSEEVVNVKAKTNERMDAVGRMEGMMAQAVVLMSRMA